MRAYKVEDFIREHKDVLKIIIIGIFSVICVCLIVKGMVEEDKVRSEFVSCMHDKKCCERMDEDKIKIVEDNLKDE